MMVIILKIVLLIWHWCWPNNSEGYSYSATIAIAYWLSLKCIIMCLLFQTESFMKAL